MPPRKRAASRKRRTPSSTSHLPPAEPEGTPSASRNAASSSASSSMLRRPMSAQQSGRGMAFDGPSSGTGAAVSSGGSDYTPGKGLIPSMELVIVLLWFCSLTLNHCLLAARFQMLSDMHSQKERTLLKTISQLQEKNQALEEEKQSDRRSRNIQKMTKDVRAFMHPQRGESR